MLQTIKSTAVLGTLLIVGYGVHVVLNKPPTEDDPIWNNAAEFSLPSIDFGNGATAPAAENPLASTNQAPQPNPLSSPPGTGTDTSNPPPAAFPIPGGGGYPTTGATDFPPLAGFPPEESTSRQTGSAHENGTGNAVEHGVGHGELGSAPPRFPAAHPQPVSPGISPQPGHGTDSATMAPEAGPIAKTSHIASGFDDMWSSAQQKLQNGDLVNALLILSMLYNDDSLYDVQRDRLITVLDQLAGTVIYSPQHHVSPAYVVAPGDTWESIAAQLQISAAFLSRVNGLSLQTPLPPGQQLKVVTGPFRGELSLTRRELTLFLNRYYAGRFNVGIGRDLPAHASALEVSEKSGPRPYFDPRTGQTIPPGASESPYGQFWIGLRAGGQADAVLGIHDMGPGVPSSDTRGCVTVSSRDADDLQAILSIGSRIELVR